MTLVNKKRNKNMNAQREVQDDFFLCLRFNSIIFIFQFIVIDEFFNF